MDMLKTYARYCNYCRSCNVCDINDIVCDNNYATCTEALMKAYDSVCDILIQFNQEYPIKTNKDALLEVFPQALKAKDDENSAGDDELPAILPCKILPSWINGHCPEYYPFDCGACRRLFWESEYEGKKDE